VVPRFFVLLDGEPFFVLRKQAKAKKSVRNNCPGSRKMMPPRAEE